MGSKFFKFKKQRVGSSRLGLMVEEQLHGRESYLTDKTLWLAIFVLMMSGLVMVYSASFIYSQERFHDGLFFFKKHLLFTGLGLGAFLLGLLIPTQFFFKRSLEILVGATVLLLLALIPGISHKAGGASRWLNLGLFKFQPSELAKAAVLIYIAAQIQRKDGSPQNFRTGFLAYFVSAIPVYFLLLLQPDFGTVALLLLTTIFILTFMGISLRYIFSTVGILLPIGILLVASKAYRRARIMAYIDPWSDAAGRGFQVIQSLVAVYSGKWFGVGLGNSKEKLFYLPEAHNDFIFAVVGEELGVLGVVFFSALFLIIVLRGIRTAAFCKNLFDQSLALGIAFMFGLQAFLNMGIVLGLLPTKGLPLPLVSYGGSSLVMSLFLLGVLARLSRQRGS